MEDENAFVDKKFKKGSRTKRRVMRESDDTSIATVCLMIVGLVFDI